ncbi:MAG: TatD family hydrolase [Anaerolineaceae bacterium]|nr:TatD family hydrolase [Anaerolineaceae bacterium]
MIDTHCHLNFDSYDEDRDAVITRAIEASVTTVIIPAVDIETSREAIDLSNEYSGIYGAVGIHPNSTSQFAETDVDTLEALAQSEKVVAIGEIGLDYYWDKSPKAKQKDAFEAQLDLAAKLNLPVIIHNREASEDVIDILEAWAKSLEGALRERPGVMHSFSAPQQIAERAIAAGFYLGFTGPITFKKADELRSIAARVPLDKILVETDGPFLTPHPYRGKRNEPAYIPYIVDRLASLHQILVEEMAAITTTNAHRLFGLGTDTASS